MCYPNFSNFKGSFIRRYSYIFIKVFYAFVFAYFHNKFYQSTIKKFIGAKRASDCMRDKPNILLYNYSNIFSFFFVIIYWIIYTCNFYNRFKCRLNSTVVGGEIFFLNLLSKIILASLRSGITTQ